MKTNSLMSIARGGAVIIALDAVAALAYGASPWDGLWDLDKSNSHYSAHTYSLTRLPDGMWRYGDGPGASLFAIDGKPYPEPNAPDFTMTARMTAGGVLELIESGYGRDVQRDRWELSKDGAALSITSTRIYPDGHEVTNTSSAVRVSGTLDFSGVWKEVQADDSHNRPAGASDPHRDLQTHADSRPYWVISTAPNGVMSWFIPATGELIRGKPDGSPRPISGPQQPSGRTFVWKIRSARHLEFFASDNGHMVARASETLSVDGQTFTDELWSVGHENEKDIRVFRKR